MEELISIIVPIYNSRKYLNNCVSSILNQTFTNLEVILIDDGSNDDSGIICDEFSKRDKRIIVKHIHNGGVSNARNIGLDIAIGKYVAFIDSDDFLGPNYIMELYNNLIDNKSDLSICPVQIVDNQLSGRWEVDSVILDFKDLDKALFLKLNKTYLLYGPCNKLYINEIIQKNNIRFITNISYGEDLIFNFQYYRYIDKISITNKVCYYYVQANNESLSKKYFHNKFEISKKIHFTLLSFFQHVNLTDNESYQFLYNRLFDDVYNSLFLINHANFGKGICNSFKYVKSILKDDELDKCIKYADTSKYSNKVVGIIKHRNTIMFLAFACLARLNFKLNGGTI